MDEMKNKNEATPEDIKEAILNNQLDDLEEAAEKVIEEFDGTDVTEEMRKKEEQIQKEVQIKMELGRGKEFRRPLAPYTFSEKKNVFENCDITMDDILYFQYKVSMETINRNASAQTDVVKVIDDIMKETGERARRIVCILADRELSRIMDSQLMSSVNNLLKAGVISPAEIAARMDKIRRKEDASQKSG